ncbi:omega-hydroxypalmitate O-feruloyl transferase [Magnolia sinica]|uniref:omega-hydroxypalmitate O-feruloyl transferase n=1 Tax=Magnolia sinica TaxID=86752 RepID=UPI002659268C|nr:omega-hydroxypalmitate O-feruloyl transferase [Magnolia sinica]
MAPSIQELHFPPLNIPITIDHIYLVEPAGPIPAMTGDHLYLSNLDDAIGAHVLTPTVYFYRMNSPDRRPVTKTIRDALAHVLVPYYPFSGRLRETKNGKLEVFFGPEQGVLMVEANSEMAIDDLGGLVAPNPAWAPLVYHFPDEGPYKIVDMPLLIAQLTNFSCGGFSLGLRLCHCICDGIGAMQFVDAWATMARLGPTVITEPCWDREYFQPRVPPMVKFPHVEFARIDDGSNLSSNLGRANLVQKCYRVSQPFQAQLKQLSQSNGEDTCTTFDAVAAHVWRCWVKALDIRPLDYDLRLTFAVNVRPKLIDPPLKDGFYGNAVCVACATSTVGQLVDGQISAVGRLVREARLGMSEEYVRSTIDYIEVDRPTRLEFAGKLTITQWTRFSIYESSDFGYGRPVYAGPIDLKPTPQMCVFLPDGGPSPDGSMILWICLPESAASKFRECLFEVEKRL